MLARGTIGRYNAGDNLIDRQSIRQSIAYNNAYLTFKMEAEEDQLYNVNKFLEAENNSNWKEYYNEKIAKLNLAVNKHLLAAREGENEEADELNMSNTSEDYAFQRSETILKAVNYFDEIDSDPTLTESETTVQEMKKESERLVKICKKYQNEEPYCYQ